MAVTDWDRVTAVTRKGLMPGISDAISKKCITATRILAKAKKRDGGSNISIPVRYALDSQGGGYSGLQVLDAAQYTGRTRAEWSWKQMYQPIVVSNIDIAKNKGKERVLDIVAQSMEDAKLSMSDKLGTWMFEDGTSDSSTVFEGLVAAVDNGTNVGTYGGVVRSTYTWFKSDYTASGGAIAISTLASTYDACSTNGQKPTIHITTEALWTQYEQLLHPQARFNFQGGYPKVDGAFDSLSYRGKPVVADEYCTSGYWYMLHEPSLQMWYMDHPDYPTDKHGLAMSDLERPVSQDGKVGFIFYYANLTNISPRYSGVIRGLT